MIFDDFFRGDDGKGSSTKLCTISSCFVILSCMIMCTIKECSEGIILGLGGLAVTLAGGPYMTARLSADSVQKSKSSQGESDVTKSG